MATALICVLLYQIVQHDEFRRYHEVGYAVFLQIGVAAVEVSSRQTRWLRKPDSNRWSHLTYDGDAFQNTSAYPGGTAPEDGSAENGMRTMLLAIG